MACLRTGCSYPYSAAIGIIDCNSGALPLELCRARVPSRSSSSSGRLGDRRSVNDGGGGGAATTAAAAAVPRGVTAGQRWGGDGGGLWLVVGELASLVLVLPLVEEGGAGGEESQSTSCGTRVGRFLQQSPLLALSSKFLAASCAPDLGDIATYFFFEKIFRSDIRICVLMTSFLVCYDIIQ